MDATALKEKFDTALDYDAYLKTGTDEQRKRWGTVEPLVHLTDAQRTLLGGFVREMQVLCISGIWCGDCVQQVPLLHAIAQANPARIHLKIVDRDVHKDLSERFQINKGLRVPTVLFMAEDFEFCGIYGDRTISRYRAIASRQLGPACPVGIAPPDKDEMAATLQDWVNEFERVQLMLRLSARLRQKHGD
jgi:thiol-disulfide isomerase/thioredoxin